MKEPDIKPPIIYMAWFFSLLFLGLVGVLSVLYSTRWGAGLSDDSFYYIRAARDWLAGYGFNLTPHFPPILPLLLSATGLIGLDPLVAVRWINALLFGLNIYLTGWLIYRISHSLVFSITGALLFLASNTLIEAHSWAMSEPLYISFSLLGMLFFCKASRTWQPFQILIAGLLFGLAAASRYIGVSLLIAGAFVLLTWKPPSATLVGGRRYRSIFWFALAGIAPLFAWIIRNQVLTGRATTRALGWHPMGSNQLLEGLNTTLLWVSPGRLVHGKELIWLGGVILLLSGWVVWKVAGERDFIHHQTRALLRSRLIYFLIVYLFSYSITLILARTLFDSRIPLDSRLLSPILSVSIILLMALIAKLWTEGGLAVRSAVLLCCFYLLFVNGTRSFETIQSYHEAGRGYAGARNHISETYAYLRNRPDIPVFSNALAGIYFWTGRDTDPIPSSSGVEVMKADMRQTGAYLVIFDSIPVELYQVSQDELTEGLVEQIRLSEATIYRYP